MADTCRLTYFEGWGLAEQARWMLAASDIAFEQVALQEHADFAALRDSGALMFRQLPLVEIDGLKLVQSQVRAGPQRDHVAQYAHARALSPFAPNNEHAYVHAPCALHSAMLTASSTGHTTRLCSYDCTLVPHCSPLANL